jgi:hypothetical protein
MPSWPRPERYPWPSARRLARRHHWPRQVGNDGVARVIVPLGQVRAVPRITSPNPTEPAEFSAPGPAEAVAGGRDPRTAESGPGSGLGSTDPLAQAVEALREQLGIANRRVDELQTALAEEGARAVTVLR